MADNLSSAVGSSASIRFTVTDDDTALAVGSGDVPVLGTPCLIAWCEAATVAALTDELDQSDGGASTSVGYKISLDHLAPTVVGASVDVSATVEAVDGRQVTFRISATEVGSEGETVVMTGAIVRVVVDRAKFISRLG